jgi:hypothetical protein
MSERACGPLGASLAKAMKKISYDGYRFPPEIIQQAIWLLAHGGTPLLPPAAGFAEDALWNAEVRCRWKAKAED